MTEKLRLTNIIIQWTWAAKNRFIKARKESLVSSIPRKRTNFRRGTDSSVWKIRPSKSGQQKNDAMDLQHLLRVTCQPCSAKSNCLHTQRRPFSPSPTKPVKRRLVNNRIWHVLFTKWPKIQVQKESDDQGPFLRSVRWKYCILLTSQLSTKVISNRFKVD